MPDYNANIRVSADTKKAESEISKLQTRLNQISDFSLKLNSKDIGRQVNQIGQQLRGIGERGLLGGLTLAAGKSVTALSALGAKLGVVGAAAAAAGGTINSALGGLPGVISEILGQVGQIPNAFGLAAVAAMAFAPQLTKAAASAVGLGAAVDKAVGAKATQGIASAVAGVTQLNTQLNATQATFAGLLSNDPLNKLVAQLRDAQKQVGEYQAFSEGSFEAVEQLLTVERLVTKEKRAQAALYSQLNSEARQLKAQVQQNVIASRNSRSGSGFNSFSNVASALEGSSAVDKAIRRNYEKRIRNAPAAPAAPLMLPSSEMLFSGNRRIERLTADPGLQAASAYTRELGKAVAPAKQLDGIFTQVSKAMSATADGAAEGNRITQSWLKALREMAQIKDDIAETTAREVQLQQKAAATETANKRKAFGRQAESLALGVGFPLLFGGGPGAVGGAALGSFVGSGFGGQILGGAIGQAMDQFAQGVAKVGNAMRAPIANFKELADANLLAGKAQATYIQKLIEAGRTAEASALIQAEITKKIGVQGMKDLQNAGAASDKLNKAMAKLNLQMQAAVAGPLAGFLSWMAKLVNVANTRNSIEAQQAEIYKNLNPNDRKSFARAVDRTKSGATLFSSDLGQREAELQRIFDTYRAKLPQRPASAPGTTVESQQARATTQELQKQVELSRANLGLAGLTLEKDGARYVAAAKNVALQELDNKLLEIKNSWIGKIFDKERNLAMIRSANLDYQAKLQQINAQVAQKAVTDSNSLLQQEQALLKVRSDALNTIVQYQTAVMGEEAGLEKRVALNERIENIRRGELEIERELALREAAKNGTTQTTLRIYSARKALLEMELELEKQVNEKKLEQLRIDRTINENRKTISFAQQLQGVFAQTPINRTPMEQLQFDQATRRGNMLNPLYQQRNELQMQLENKTLDPQSDQAKQLVADLSRVNSEIGKMGTALTFVESKEIAWQKNRAGAEALANVLNGVGSTITNVFGNLVTGTDNWANSLLNVFNIFANLLAQAGLNALAGTDGRGFFSILNGTFGRKAAKGAYFSNGVAAFGMGGTFANSIVRTPTLFKYAKGGALATGVMGEAGPEAVMPLTRGPNGKLGVSSYGGGGGVSVVVNVDASGSSVQGNDQRANELGRVVSVAVQQEIIKQKRPGGLLA